MTQDKDPGDAPMSTTSPSTERTRTSLKEIAARASQAVARSPTGAPPPSSRPSLSASATPPPPSIAPSQPSPATPPPRPLEATKDDSGLIDLNVVHSSATAPQIVAAERAKPAQGALFEEEPGHSVQVIEGEGIKSWAEQPGLAKSVKVAGVAAKKSNTGMISGIAIAALGIGAAFAILHRKPTAPTIQAPVVVVSPERLALPAPNGAIAAAPAPQSASVALPIQIPAVPTPGAVDSRSAEPPRGAVASAPQAVVAGGAAAPSKEAPADPRLAAKSAQVATGAPGDLQSEMARAVGPSNDGDKSAQALPVLEPAAGARSQNIPEQPSQGSIQAAVGAVVVGAKACVVGADEVSRAQVTFSSAGSVSSVSVTGWAAAHGKSGCIQAALKGAKVGPFSRSSYVVPVPIRP
jgi:hypothetical protein